MAILVLLHQGVQLPEEVHRRLTPYYNPPWMLTLHTLESARWVSTRAEGTSSPRIAWLRWSWTPHINLFHKSLPRKPTLKSCSHRILCWRSCESFLCNCESGSHGSHWSCDRDLWRWKEPCADCVQRQLMTTHNSLKVLTPGIRNQSPWGMEYAKDMATRSDPSRQIQE